MKQMRLGYGLLGMIALYFAAHHAQKYGWGHEIFRFYIKDILLIPILLSAVTFTFKVLDRRFYPGNKEITSAVLYATVLFEFVLPHFGMSFATDPLDILCYAVGGYIFKLVSDDFHLIELNIDNEPKPFL